jgi:flagellar hook-associated protein 2
MAGTTSISGLLSGIDGASLAKSVADQLSLPNEIHKQSISKLGAENSSLETLKTLLLDLADKLDALSTRNGGSAVKQASSSNNQVVTAAAGGTAAKSSFNVNISSLAASGIGTFDRSFGSADDFIVSDTAQSGTVQFTVGSGESSEAFSVAVGPTTTAQDFVDEFNDNADGAATAYLINLGTEENPEYRIGFSSAEQGTEKGSISVEFGNSALGDASALAGATVEQATNAVFSISGIAGTFERSSNTISDAISGITLELHSTGFAQITVAQSGGASANQVEAFVSSFNALAKFVNEEDKVTVTQEDGATKNSFGSLSGTSVDEDALSGLRSAIAGAKSADGSMSLASLGVSTNKDGTLAFDRKKFDASFGANPQGAAEAITSLADKISGAEGVVNQFAGYGRQIDSAITGNESEISRLNETIAKVDRNASQREESVLKQFTSLESLLAKLNADSGFISSLLQF